MSTVLGLKSLESVCKCKNYEHVNDVFTKNSLEGKGIKRAKKGQVISLKVVHVAILWLYIC